MALRGPRTSGDIRGWTDLELQRERLKTALLQDSWLGPVITDADAELRRLRKHEQPDGGDSSSR